MLTFVTLADHIGHSLYLCLTLRFCSCTHSVTIHQDLGSLEQTVLIELLASTLLPLLATTVAELGTADAAA
jgi:hypothetical protein